MKLQGSDISRLISRALRHDPWLFELELDDEGWVELGSLLAALRDQGQDWAQLTSDDIVRVVKSSSKRRHEVVDGRIRALYGHSLPGRLMRQPAKPPEILFHGTSKESARKILKVGLLPMGRQYVHLSVNTEMAVAVGCRKSTHPVLIRVEAQGAAANGVRFYIGNENVWLADAVPDAYLACDDALDIVD